MQTVEVAVQTDHLERLSRTKPLLGLAELVWNGLDADARRVDIRLQRNDLSGLERIVIEDDGHGMTHNEVVEEFAKLGGSWKAGATTSRTGERALHGSRGEGRFRAFSLGQSITWSSVSERDGPRQLVIVRGTRSSLRRFEIEDPEATQAAIGTYVEVDTAQETPQGLEGEGAAGYLSAQLALYLEKYPSVRVVYDGRTLDPSNEQLRDDTYDLDDFDPPAVLRVVEWASSVDRALYLCDADGFALQELPVGIHAPGYDFTAYLLSETFSELGMTDIAVGEMHPGVQPILERARDVLRNHFKERSAQRGHERIARWKGERSYPYRGQPDNPVEQAEREVFDVLALEVSDRVPDFEGTNSTTRRLSFRLLREALERSPGSLHAILHEVLDLPPEEQDELARLLDRTTLGAIIRASRVVADRLDFLMGLEDLLFDPQSREQLLERSQMHRILAEETWIWGEAFNLTVDDRSLEEVLRAHLRIMDRRELSPGPVSVPEQASGIVDLMLSRVAHSNRAEREHLVVELKRPSKPIGSDEITQIKKYAYAVASDERFRSTSCTWEFWLVGNRLNEFAEQDVRQDGRPPGLIVDKDGMRVWVKSWSQVLDECRARLRFFREQLDYTSTDDTARAYLREKHAEHLPPALSDAEDAASHTESGSSPARN